MITLYTSDSLRQSHEHQDKSVDLACLKSHRSVRHTGNLVAKVAALRGEVRVNTQVLDSSEQELQLPVSRRGSVLRNHVSRELDGNVSETTLSVPFAKVTSAGKSAQVQLLMVRDEEVVGGIAAEALGAVPGHVLDRHERTVGQEDKVEHSVADDSAVVLLDDTREDAEARWRRGVVVEDAVAALLPLLDWSVDCTLHICAVEVDGGALREVANASWEAQNIP